MGTERLRHQFNHLFDNISEGVIKGNITHSLVQLSICMLFISHLSQGYLWQALSLKPAAVVRH